MIHLGGRVFDEEIMDGTDWTLPEYKQTLLQLQTLNRWSRGYAPTLAAISRVVRKQPQRTWRVLDLGFGYGDTLREIEAWADRTGAKLELSGVDLNPLSERWAREAGARKSKIRYFTGNALDLPDHFEFDMIINSLFMHHLNDDEGTRVLSWMTDRAKHSWFANDLHRHFVSYIFLKYGTRLCGFNRLVCHDGPLSVRRSFTRADWFRLLGRAQVPEAAFRVRWHFPFRYGVFCDAARARRLRED